MAGRWNEQSQRESQECTNKVYGSLWEYNDHVEILPFLAEDTVYKPLDALIEQDNALKIRAAKRTNMGRILVRFSHIGMVLFCGVAGGIFVLQGGMEAGDAADLFLAAGKGMCIFLLNVLLMYGINVYGDSWAVKLSFFAAENGYKKVSAMPVCNVKNRFSGGDIFNRIVAGTGHIIGLWFSTIDVISGLAATGILLYLFAGQSFWIMATVGALVFF